jgi:hypothetical protein
MPSESKGTSKPPAWTVAEHGMWGYPESYIPVPGGWNQSLTTKISEQHDENHRPEAAPIPAAEPEPEPA